LGLVAIALIIISIIIIITIITAVSRICIVGSRLLISVIALSLGLLSFTLSAQRSSRELEIQRTHRQRHREHNVSNAPKQVLEVMRLEGRGCIPFQVSYLVGEAGFLVSSQGDYKQQVIERL